jgi:FKBP-type peptidyl-prolyl cis-trans isomerase 2
VITDVTEENVTIDANHPLAGLPLTFDIELVEIVSEE